MAAGAAVEVNLSAVSVNTNISDFFAPADPHHAILKLNFWQPAFDYTINRQ